jgi:hypothetical protein
VIKRDGVHFGYPGGAPHPRPSFVHRERGWVMELASEYLSGRDDGDNGLLIDDVWENM